MAEINSVGATGGITPFKPDPSVQLPNPPTVDQMGKVDPGQVKRARQNPDVQARVAPEVISLTLRNLGGKSNG